MVSFLAYISNCNSQTAAIVRTIPSGGIITIEHPALEGAKVGDTITLYDKQTNSWEMVSEDITTGVVVKITSFGDWQEAEVSPLIGEESLYVNDYLVGLYEIGDTIKIVKKKSPFFDQKELDWQVYSGNLSPGSIDGRVVKYAVIRKKWR